MSETMTLPPPAAPVERRCRFEDVFDASLLELIRLVPGNPLVRALILKLTGKLPGAECATFEQVREWIEANCDRRQTGAVPNGTGRRTRNDGISIAVEFSDTEYGRAAYSVRRHGNESFHINAEDLLAIVREASEDGDGIDKIVEAVAGKIRDDAWDECDPSLADSGDYDYNDHDASDTEDSKTEFSKSDVRTAVLAFVRERHPELAAEL